MQVRVPPKDSSKFMAAVMFTYAVVVTVVYLVNKDPFFHEVMYGVLVFTLLGMDLHLNMVQYSAVGIKVFLAGFLM